MNELRKGKEYFFLIFHKLYRCSGKDEFMRRKFAKNYYTERQSAMGKRHILRDAAVRHPLNMFFLFAFLLGIVCMNLWIERQPAVALMLQSYFLWEGQGVEVSREDLFIFLLKERGVLFFLLAFLGNGRYRRLFFGGFAVYAGFMTGMILTSCLLTFGLIGMMFFMSSLFPQMIFYVLLYFLIVKSAELLKTQNQEYIRHFSGKERMLLLCFVGFLLFLFLLGVASEAYINPILLEKTGEIVLK